MKFLELCLYIEFEQSSILNSFLIICVYIIIKKRAKACCACNTYVESYGANIECKTQLLFFQLIVFSYDVKIN